MSICLESGCGFPVHYSLTSRCNLHAVEWVTSGQYKTEYRPGGVCQNCDQPAERPTATTYTGRPPLRCAEHAGLWIKQRTALMRLSRTPSKLSFLSGEDMCKRCGDVIPINPLSSAKPPNRCPSCGPSGVSITKRKCHGGCGTFLAPGQKRCVDCVERSEALARQWAERENARLRVESAIRALEVVECWEESCSSTFARGRGSKRFCDSCGAARARESNRRNDGRRRGYRMGAESVSYPEVLAASDGKCVYCGSSENMTVDHVLPLARGGQHVRENLVAACWSCNCSKQSLTPEEWFASGRPLVPEHLRT